VLLRI